MTLEMWIIALTRVLGSLPVLRWAFLGGILAVLVDQSDLFLMNLIHLGGVDNYQTFDKYLDQVYLLSFLIASQRWEGWPRRISLGLYVYRFAGFALFEATEARWLLLLFPNFFEFWFLAFAGFKFFRLEGRFSSRSLTAMGLCLVGLKLFQEYALHYARWLDGFTAVEAVEAIWRWLTGPVS